MAPDPRYDETTLRSFNNKFATLVVGPEQQKLGAHLSELQYASPFFQAAFKDEWKEGQESQILLPEDDPHTVKVYLEFIYSGRLASKPPHGIDARDRVAHGRELLLLARLYCFGEKYQDVKLKNAIIDAIIAKARPKGVGTKGWYPTGEEVDIIYRGTCSRSPIRKLLIDLHVRYGQEGWLSDSINNNEFVLDLARALIRVKKADVGRGEPINSEYYESKH